MPMVVMMVMMVIRGGQEFRFRVATLVPVTFLTTARDELFQAPPNNSFTTPFGDGVSEGAPKMTSPSLPSGILGLR